MPYDINPHLKDQIENLLEGFRIGNHEIVSDSMGNINELVDENFGKILKTRYKELEALIESKKNRSFDIIRTNPEVKNYDDILQVISRTENERIEDYNEYLQEWKTLLFKYIKKLPWNTISNHMLL